MTCVKHTDNIKNGWTIKNSAHVSAENKEAEPQRKVTSIYAWQVLNFIGVFHRCVSSDAQKLNILFLCQFTW